MSLARLLSIAASIAAVVWTGDQLWWLWGTWRFGPWNVTVAIMLDLKVCKRIVWREIDNELNCLLGSPNTTVCCIVAP